MSGIAGTLVRGRGTLDRAVIASLSRGLAAIGPDGEEIAWYPPVAMAVRVFDTEFPATTERDLVRTERSVLAWDGRIDNRRELADSLRLEANENVSDARLMQAAFERWGTECCTHVVGEFAFAAFSQTDESVVLCTDRMGRRPLYYAVAGDRILWSSSARGLHGALGLPLNLDENYLADFLLNRAPAGGPFCSIDAVGGGHIIVADARRTERRRYWFPEREPLIRYRTDDEYAEHFRALFRDAISCRLPRERAVVAEVSGGLDSSAIACIAGGLTNAGGGRRLHTLSWIFDESRTADESDYIRAAETAIGGPAIHLLESECPLLLPVPDSMTPDVPSTSLCFLAHESGTVRAARGVGARVLLSGVGGDQMFWSQPDPALLVADAIAARRISEAFREAMAWAAVVRTPVPRVLGRALRYALPRPLQPRVGRCEPWIARPFAARVRMQERLLRSRSDVARSSPTRTAQHSDIRDVMRVSALECYAPDGYIDRRYPYLDSRLAEFALSIPTNQKVRLGESRSVVRRGLKGLVPEMILQRRTKSTPSEALQRGLIRNWLAVSRYRDGTLLAEYGLVEQQAFADALQAARYGSSMSMQLLCGIVLESWLRNLTRTHPKPPRRPVGGSHVREETRHEEAVHQA